MTYLTSRQFRQRTGYKPVQDDLERCNCDRAGQLMHQQCGLNSFGMPMFMGNAVHPRMRIRCLQAVRFKPARSKT